VTPDVQSDSAASKPGVVAKGSDPATLIIIEELHVEQGASPSAEAGQELLPSLLVLVAMAKEDVAVLEGRLVILRELLQSHDEILSRGGPPRPSLHQLTSSTTKQQQQQQQQEEEEEEDLSVILSSQSSFVEDYLSNSLSLKNLSVDLSI